MMGSVPFPIKPVISFVNISSDLNLLLGVVLEKKSFCIPIFTWANELGLALGLTKGRTNGKVGLAMDCFDWFSVATTAMPNHSS